jgi:hypothetical protein
MTAVFTPSKELYDAVPIGTYKGKEVYAVLHKLVCMRTVATQ